MISLNNHKSNQITWNFSLFLKPTLKENHAVIMKTANYIMITALIKEKQRKNAPFLKI